MWYSYLDKIWFLLNTNMIYKMFKWGCYKMGKEQVDYIELEKLVDDWIPNLLNKRIPRYSFIFHCNCAYVDAIIETGCFFSASESLERHMVFALNYLTHLAYKYLPEEDVFIYEVDESIYEYTYRLLMEAYKYAQLCDIFPKTYNSKASFTKRDDLIIVNEEELYRESMHQCEYYLLRKPLHYILQYGCGKTTKVDATRREMAIFDLFDSYWSENILNVDFEPYSAIEGAGLRDLLMLAAVKRYILLYDADFKVRKLRWTQLLICFSNKGASQIRTMIPTDNDEFYEQAIEDCIYKPLGKGTYPKANLADAPIIKTKDGCMFANPFLLLFNNSIDTQFLNYLRRHDNERFLKIKDKIKERCIPEVELFLDRKIKGLYKISNFELKIPGTKNKREFDLLVCDPIGNALYIEFKHFYYPESYSEKCNLDSELKKAQKKMKEQLYAIKENTQEVMHLLKSDCKINNIKGVIVSYLYTGTDVDILDEYPIISLLTVKDAIESAHSIDEIYDYCQKSEKKHSSVPLVIKNIDVEYAKMKFTITKKVFDPEFERKANQQIYRRVVEAIDAGFALKRVQYKRLNLSDIVDAHNNS